MPCLPRYNLQAVSLLSVLAVAALTGCGGSDAPTLESHLEELEFDAPTDSTVEVAVGRYHVPIALQIDKGDTYEWRRLKFQLYAVTAEKHQSSIEAAWERYRGPFQDEVIRICRRLNADELEDPRLAALKLRLTDMALPMLGEERLQQLVVNHILDEAL